MKAQPKRKHFVTTLRKTVRFLIASPVIVLVVLAAFAIPLAAFEAHVVNVTATIEPPPICDALSKGYWANHEGCSQGGGTSDWESEINDLSTNNFSSVFGITTGAEICQALWIPNCGPGNTVAGRLCRAKAQTLADELNIVSGRLQLNALIALADDGNRAFSNLGLSPISTVEEALIAVEAIMADSGATSSELRNAAYVAQRIYAFYEDENPNAPMCIYDPEDIPDRRPRCPRPDRDSWGGWGGESSGFEILDGGGDGGTITTGDAYAEACIINIVNTNVTEIDTCGDGDCHSDGDITVENNNDASVKNGVGAIANTGDNTANGGEGSSSGDGNATSTEEINNEDDGGEILGDEIFSSLETSSSTPDGEVDGELGEESSEESGEVLGEEVNTEATPPLPEPE